MLLGGLRTSTGSGMPYPPGERAGTSFDSVSLMKKTKQKTMVMYEEMKEKKKN